MASSFTRFRDDLLLALAEADSAEGLPKLLDAQTIAEHRGLTFTVGWVRKAVETMEHHGWVKAKYSHRGGNPDLNVIVLVKGPGLEKADRLMQERQTVPVADRTVRIDHNAPAYQEVLYGFRQTIEAIEGSNEYADADLEDQKQRIAELNAGRILLEPVTVRVQTLLAVIKPALEYLAKKFGDAAIGKAASALLAALVKWLGLA